jgi:glutamyl-tRNA synthetase
MNKISIREDFIFRNFQFDISGFQDANPRFFMDKLDWFNGEYIRQLSDESLNSKFVSASLKFTQLPQSTQLEVTKLVKDRIKKISDINEFAKFFWESPKVDTNLFGTEYKKHLSDAISVIESVKDWKLETLNEKFMEVVKSKGYKTGDFFMSLRLAITGSKFTPPINDSIIILGKEETLSRIKSLL